MPNFPIFEHGADLEPTAQSFNVFGERDDTDVGPVLDFGDLSLIDAEDFGELQLRHLLGLAQVLFKKPIRDRDKFFIAAVVAGLLAPNHTAVLFCTKYGLTGKLAGIMDTRVKVETGRQPSGQVMIEKTDSTFFGFSSEFWWTGQRVIAVD